MPIALRWTTAVNTYFDINLCISICISILAANTTLWLLSIVSSLIFSRFKNFHMQKMWLVNFSMLFHLHLDLKFLEFPVKVIKMNWIPWWKILIPYQKFVKKFSWKYYFWQNSSSRNFFQHRSSELDNLITSANGVKSLRTISSILHSCNGNWNIDSGRQPINRVINYLCFNETRVRYWNLCLVEFFSTK